MKNNSTKIFMIIYLLLFILLIILFIVVINNIYQVKIEDPKVISKSELYKQKINCDPIIIDIVFEKSKKYNIDADIIISIIYTESRFQNIKGYHNRNRSQDFGYMQLNNYYFKGDLLNPEFNIDTGTKFFCKCLQQEHGNITKALQRYNTWNGRVSLIYIDNFWNYRIFLKSLEKE